MPGLPAPPRPRLARLARWLINRLARHAGHLDEEDRLHAVLDHLPAMVARFDREGRCLFVNERALQIYGLRLEQALGMRLLDLLSPQEYALFSSHLPKVLAGERARYEGAGVFEGRTIHYQTNLVPDRGCSGDVVGYLLMTFDISSLRELQERLVRSEQRLRAITDNVPAGITYIDADLRVQFANRKFREWVGVRWNDITGTPFRDIAGEAAYAEREAALAKAMAGERVSFELETSLQGIQRCLQALYVPDRDDHDRVQGLYILTTDITELRTAERDMAMLAFSDPLTRLPNRRRLEERLPEALARARRQGTSTGLMFLDIDRFKHINDGHGHAVGDAVLVAFGQRLTGAVRNTDFIARFAGDEFVIVLEGLRSAEPLEKVAQKIALAMAQPMQANGTALRVSSSIGGILIPAEDERAPADLLKAADDALYMTKAHGRNGYTIVPVASTTLAD